MCLDEYGLSLILSGPTLTKLIYISVKNGGEEIWVFDEMLWNQI